MLGQQHSAFWVTNEAHRRLKAALVDARARRTVLESGNRDVDELTSLQQELEGISSRQRRLEELLARVVVGEECPDDGVVEPGMVVTVRFASTGDEETFLLGPRELLEFDPSVDVEVYSVGSPLGAALLNASRGDRVSYLAPQGKKLTVDVVDAKPFGG